MSQSRPDKNATLTPEQEKEVALRLMTNQDVANAIQVLNNRGTDVARIFENLEDVIKDRKKYPERYLINLLKDHEEKKSENTPSLSPLQKFYKLHYRLIEILQNYNSLEEAKKELVLELAESSFSADLIRRKKTELNKKLLTYITPLLESKINETKTIHLDAVKTDKKNESLSYYEKDINKLITIIDIIDNYNERIKKENHSKVKEKITILGDKITALRNQTGNNKTIQKKLDLIQEKLAQEEKSSTEVNNSTLSDAENIDTFKKNDLTKDLLVEEKNSILANAKTAVDVQVENITQAIETAIAHEQNNIDENIKNKIAAQVEQAFYLFAKGKITQQQLEKEILFDLDKLISALNNRLKELIDKNNPSQEKNVEEIIKKSKYKKITDNISLITNLKNLLNHLENNIQTIKEIIKEQENIERELRQIESSLKKDSTYESIDEEEEEEFSLLETEEEKTPEQGSSLEDQLPKEYSATESDVSCKNRNSLFHHEKNFDPDNTNESFLTESGAVYSSYSLAHQLEDLNENEEDEEEDDINSTEETNTARILYTDGITASSESALHPVINHTIQEEKKETEQKYDLLAIKNRAINQLQPLNDRYMNRISELMDLLKNTGPIDSSKSSFTQKIIQENIKRTSQKRKNVRSGILEITSIDLEEENAQEKLLETVKKYLIHIKPDMHTESSMEIEFNKFLQGLTHTQLARLKHGTTLILGHFANLCVAADLPENKIKQSENFLKRISEIDLENDSDVKQKMKDLLHDFESHSGLHIKINIYENGALKVDRLSSHELYRIKTLTLIMSYLNHFDEIVKSEKTTPAEAEERKKIVKSYLQSFLSFDLTKEQQKKDFLLTLQRFRKEVKEKFMPHAIQQLKI